MGTVRKRLREAEGLASTYKQQMHHLTAMITELAQDVGIEKTWPDTLHPHDILEKHVFRALNGLREAERAKRALDWVNRLEMLDYESGVLVYIFPGQNSKSVSAPSLFLAIESAMEAELNRVERAGMTNEGNHFGGTSESVLVTRMEAARMLAESPCNVPPVYLKDLLARLDAIRSEAERIGKDQHPMKERIIALADGSVDPDG